jgi:hypothetical protein
MAGSVPSTTNIRGINNNTSSNQVNNASPSRLLLSTNGIRNDLQSRNLYTPNRIYPITEKNQLQNILNAVNGIASLVAPFKGYDLTNTVYGRLITQQTPLTIIGLAMLGNQFAQNAASHIAQQNFPTIKLANLFDGSKNTHLFTKNINFTITRKPAVTNFQQFLDAVVFYDPASNNPFKGSKTTNLNTIPIDGNPTVQNSYYIQQTNSGQITFLINALNQNIYKQGFGSTSTDKALQNAATDAEIKFYERKNLIGDHSNPLNKYKRYFNFFNANPYSNIFINSDASLADINGDAVEDMNIPAPTTVPTQEYAPTQDFIDANFGQSNNNGTGSDYQLNQDANSWVGESSEFPDTLDSKIVWGKDSIKDDRWNADTRGTFAGANKSVTTNDNLEVTFNVWSGLLEYTKNLVNASEGALVDLTRKAFVKGKNKNVQGFNGSALWTANFSTYANSSNTAGQSGVRQHSQLDQYDRFAKAIRFNGNKVYGGNQNSVLYNSVLPRIHPTTPVDANGVPNNKNLMFSLENLAVRVISKDGVGIIDDEYGSQIPICEVGQFNGRQMWFPPYNLELNESSQAKFEPTVMVGRNEPMYSYMYSERSATLTFTLLVDYPQNLKNQQYQNPNQHRAIAEFFAFGGNAYAPAPIIPNTNQKTVQNQAHIDVITGPTNTGEPEINIPTETKMVFPNDMPVPGDENTIIDTMYEDINYQAKAGSFQSNGNKVTVAQNKEIFYIIESAYTGTLNVNMKLDASLLPAGFSEYTYSGIKSTLDQKLNYVFGTPANRTMFAINIIGAASKLYKDTYNQSLGLRRANAAKYLVQQRLKALFPNDDLTGIVINISSVGSTLSDPKLGTPAEIENSLTIAERFATISFVRTRQTPPQKIPTLGLPDIANINHLKADNLALEKVGAKQNSKNITQCVYEERKSDVNNDYGDGAILTGFKSIEGNYYYPVFHTQTPEDFHRRLTFLQQCLRQGAAKHFSTSTDNNGVLRARNSIFGRQPICVLRVGDFFFTKVIIENLQIDYTEATWDMNPEGFGMQPMIAKVTLQMKVIGGQSLKGPIDALQNAITFNYYANSSFTNQGLYNRPSTEADNQEKYINGILAVEKDTLNKAYNQRVAAIQTATQVATQIAMSPLP